MTKKQEPAKTDQAYKDQIKKKFEEFYLTRDKKLRDELIKEHMYIVDILSNKYVGKGIEKDDLYQVASLGLIYACLLYTSPSPRDS